MSTRTGGLMNRCFWAGDDPLMIDYHDKEWGKPVHDDRIHYEFLVLEGAQAGLSWMTVLKKREGYRRLFAEFDPERVALFSRETIEDILQEPSIIRNRLKIESAVTNAKAFLAVQREFGAFDTYIWQFVDGRPIRNRWKNSSDIPVSTELSEKISKDLKKRGFRFVGPTIVYSYLQAVGIVDDHMDDCDFKEKMQ